MWPLLITNNPAKKRVLKKKWYGICIVTVQAQPLFLHVQYLLPCYKLQVFEAYVCAENSEREGSQQQLSEDNLEVCDTDCMWLFGIPKFLIS